MAKPAISRFALSAARYAKGSPTKGAGERSETERFNLLYLRNQRRVNLFQIQLEQFRHTILLHGHAVQDIGGLHGAAAVGDDDELGLVAHPAQILREPADVGIVQRGFDLIELPDGNDLDAIEAALSKPTMPGKPKAILAHTVKGKGVSFMENQVGWHGKAPNAEQREQALKELED